MKTLSKNIINLTEHALFTPCQKLVVTATRQSGNTWTLLKMAHHQASPKNKILILGYKSEMVKSKRDVFEHLYGVSPHVTFASSFSNEIGNRVKNNRTCKWENLTDFKEIYMDYESECEVGDMVLPLVIKRSNVRVVMVRTGGNLSEWHKRVDDLCDQGFTAIFLNPPRHPKFMKEMHDHLGDEMFNREYKSCTGANIVIE